MQLFQGDAAFQALIPGFPHHAHSTAAHDVLQAVSIGDESHWCTHCTPITPLRGIRSMFNVGHRRELGRLATAVAETTGGLATPDAAPPVLHAVDRSLPRHP